jgi:glyoxylase-like metal-dependent hydrolase (beta-lactamase superfamily II)
MVLTSMLAIALAGCGNGSPANDTAAETPLANSASPAATAGTSIVRLDCGTIKVGDFSKAFSDKQIYPHQAKTLTDSCYLVTHNGQQLLWDTGLPAALKGKTQTEGDFTTTLTKTVPEQLAQLGVKPQDIDFVGISHMHFDHTGQAAQFPQATLLIGKPDYDQSAGKDDPFGPWRKGGNGGSIKFVVSGEADVFGDGSVTALFLPGHTAGHMALLVKLASGPVLLSGDLYHASEAREQRGVPGFNSSREETLASMDKFEALAKQNGAKVIIQHEPDDIAKLPSFPQAAE